MDNNQLDSNGKTEYGNVDGQNRVSDISIQDEADSRNDRNKEYYTKILSKCGLYLSITAIVIIAVQAILIFISHSYLKGFYNSDWFELTVTAIGMLCAGVPLYYILMKRLPDSEKGEVKKLSLNDLFQYFIICVAVMYLSNIVGTVVNFIIETIKGAEVGNPLEYVLDNSNLVITILYASILGPIAEELMFRKLLLDKVRRFGDLPAMIITGVAFGLFHMNISQLFYATTVGMILAYVTLKTNTIIYSIILHMMLNFMGSGIAVFVVRSKNIIDDGMFSLWSVAAVIAGIVLLVRDNRNIRLRKAEVPLVKVKDYILNPGTIIFIIICTVVTLIETIE